MKSYASYKNNCCAKVSLSLSYHKVRELYSLAVIFAAAIDEWSCFY